MNKQHLALLAEAVKLLNLNKVNCFPSLQKEIEVFIADPASLDQASSFLLQSKSNAGMFLKADHQKLLNKMDGRGFNEIEFFHERMPDGQ